MDASRSIFKVDPYARRAQMFPKLTTAQLARIARVATERAVTTGTILFGQGEPNVRFFVVLEGSLEILHPTDQGEELITVHEPGEFTGETDMLSGRRSLVRGRVREDGVLLEVGRDALRSLVQTDSELSEIFMRAFILRRMGLISHGQGDVVLLGSRHSAGTLRLEEFLTRNGHPHTYVDIDSETSVQETLDRFHIRIEEIPNPLQ
jgi:thioredoxin reductase (NADPH)